MHVMIGTVSVVKVLIDLGASINLMPLLVVKKIGDLELKKTRMTLQQAYQYVKHPSCIVEELLVKVDKFVFSIDFMVMDIEEDNEVPLILGKTFMKKT